MLSTPSVRHVERTAMKRQEDQEDRDTPKRIRLAHEAELKKGYTLKKSSETGAAPKTILLGTPKKAVAYNVGAQLQHQEATPLSTKRQRRPVQVEDDGTVKDWPASDLTSGNGWGLKVKVTTRSRKCRGSGVNFGGHLFSIERSKSNIPCNSICVTPSVFIGNLDVCFFRCCCSCPCS